MENVAWLVCLELEAQARLLNPKRVLEPILEN